MYMKKIILILFASILVTSSVFADTAPSEKSKVENLLLMDKRYGINTYLHEDKLVLTFDNNVGIIQCSVINTNTSETWSAEIDSSTGCFIMDFTNTPGVYIFTLHTEMGSCSCYFIIT